MTLSVIVLTLSVELYSEAGVMTFIRAFEVFSSDWPAGRVLSLTGTFQFQMLKTAKN
jgi:hypothetical protein